MMSGGQLLEMKADKHLSPMSVLKGTGCAIDLPAKDHRAESSPHLMVIGVEMTQITGVQE